MKKLNKKRPVLFYAGLLSLCLVLVTTYMMGGIYARYAASDDGGDSARVAYFSVSSDVPTQAATLTLTGLKPGDTQNVALNITYSGEVAVEYKMAVESTENLPLVYEFSDKGTGVFPTGEDHSATHTLTVTWPLDKKNVDFVSEIDVVTVVLTCTQID